MASWNVIECGFNAEDQTINFGTRCFGGEHNLFEACTLASIKSNSISEEESNVDIKCRIKCSKLFYVIDKTLGVFTDLNCTEIDLNILFEEPADILYVTDNAKYAFVGLRNGSFQLLDIEDKALLLEGKMLDNLGNEEILLDSYLQYYTDNEMVFIVVTKIGDIYRIRIKDLQGSCTFQKELVKQMHCNIRNIAFNYPYIFLNGTEMVVYHLDTGEELEDEPLDVIKVVPYDSDMFLALDINGNLIQICTKTLMRFIIKNASFRDIIFVQDKKSVKDELLFIALTNKDEMGITKLQSFESCSDFVNPIFSLKHTDDVHLINPECIYNDYMYITALKKENVTTEFRIHTVCETETEKRLERLLKRQKFDEAEKFAKFFTLDGTQILKGRAKALTTKINCNAEDIENLLQILGEIEDVEFKLQCCYDMHQLCEDVVDVWNVLQYAFCMVKDNSDKSKIEDLANKITHAVNRFNTFKLIRRYKTGLSWDDFTQYELKELLTNNLQMGNIEIAMIIYNRLDLKITSADVEKILSILDTLPLVYHKPFLYSFIPISLYHLPSSVIIFLKWLRQKVFDMEKTAFAEFPQNAIAFTNDIVKLLVHESVQMETMHSLYQQTVEDLRMLVKALNRLEFILTKYEISVQLKEYLKGSRSLISHLLNIRLSNESFNMFFDDFLYNFILENKFHPDDILLEEIESIVRYDESYWVDTIPRYLHKMNLVEKKLQAINKIALSAKVPWSEFIKSITAIALQYDHPLVYNIIKEIENEPSKTVLTKYNLHKYVESPDLEFFINRLLYCNSETMIEDVLTISRTPTDRQLANYMLFHDLIGKKRFEDALKVLHMISAEDLFVFCKDVTQIIIISSKRNYKNIQNYSPVLSCIKRRYKEKGCQNIYERNLDDALGAITSYFHIKEIHNEVIADDLLYPRRRTVLYDALIDKAVDDFENNDSNIDVLEMLINRTSKCLNVPKNDVVIKFVQKCSNSSVIQKCAEHYYLHENDPTLLCKMAALIVKSISPVDKYDLADKSIQDLTICDSTPTNNNINTLTSNVRLGQKLVIKAALKAEGGDSYICTEVLYIMKHFFGAITEKCDAGKMIYNSAYLSANIIPSLTTFCSLTQMLNTYVTCAHLYNIPNTKYLSYFSTTNINLMEEDNQQILIQIKTTIQHLCMEGHILTAFHLILFFLKSFSMGTKTDINIITALRNVLKQQCIPHLLERVLTPEAIDYQFTFTLLISITFQQFVSYAKQYITLYKANPVKLNIIMQLVMKVFKYHDVSPEQSYIKLLLLSKWWLKIDNCQVRMKTFYVSPINELLVLLLEHDHLKLEMMDEFCKDFKLDVQICYNIYLEKLITTWKPNYEIIQETDGKSKLVMKSSEDELYEKCQKVLVHLGCKDTIQRYIEKFCASINFYHYEAFLCAFKILSSLSSTNDHSHKQQLLMFMKMYSRVNKPSNLELEEWFAMFPGSRAIDPLSKWRLPFSQMFFSEDVWGILRPEINLKTYTIWFKAMPFLHACLNVDDICSFVVKDMVSSGILEKNLGSGWVLIPAHEALFEEIDRCVQHISDIEKATSVINHLMIHTSKGADQMNASKLCLKYAKQYKQSCSDPSVDDVYKKIRNKYLKCSVSHILHLCKLDSEDYGEVLLQPDELIDMLYAHNEIINSTNAIVSSCPDINKAVDDIAVLYNIDVLERRKHLLEMYLSNNNTTYNIYGNSAEDIESINLERASYICQSGDLAYWQNHLVTIGIEDTVQLHIRVKANALKCLTMISDVESIETIVDLQYNAFLNYIDKLYLLSDLERRGFTMTLEQLNNYDKKILLRRLAQDMYYPTTVKMMGDICMVYLIQDIKYWNKIIEVSIKLNLYTNLKKYIKYWSTNSDSKYKNFYINAWQHVVDNSFSTCLSSNESEIFDLCIKNILMIQSCPVLDSLNFDKVFSKLCQMDRHDFAAIIIQYMPTESQDELISEIVSNIDSVPDFSALSQRGIYGADLVDAMFRFK